MLLFAVLLLDGCAGTKLSRIAPKLSDMGTARQYLGEPTRSEELPDGTLRYEWVLDRVLYHPGGEQGQYRDMGRDRDGFRNYVWEIVYVPPREEPQYCRVQAIADQDSRIIRISWEGRNCDELLATSAAAR